MTTLHTALCRAALGSGAFRQAIEAATLEQLQKAHESLTSGPEWEHKNQSRVRQINGRIGVLEEKEPTL